MVMQHHQDSQSKGAFLGRSSQEGKPSYPINAPLKSFVNLDDAVSPNIDRYVSGILRSVSVPQKR